MDRFSNPPDENILVFNSLDGARLIRFYGIYTAAAYIYFYTHILIYPIIRNKSSEYHSL